jgi:thermostable 8-oxoguanine DNA glycosylase
MDLQQARLQAAHMMRFGNAQPVPSLKKAVWASILSANNALDRNALQVATLAPYVRNLPLPHNPEELQALIATCGWNPPLAHCEAIIEADTFCNTPSATLTQLETRPATMREWVVWRKLLVQTFKGISWKTASFVALLMWPFQSPFGIVDRHILAHYGKSDLSNKISNKCKPAYLRYRSVERLEAKDARRICAELQTVCNVGIVHWAIWDQQRNDTSPEHDLMSAYAY